MPKLKPGVKLKKGVKLKQSASNPKKIKTRKDQFGRTTAFA